jgi:hypothetical protein
LKEKAMNKEIEFLENSLGPLYDALDDASDEGAKAEIKSAIGQLNDRIETLYESAPKASKGDPDRNAARREGKAAAKASLKRISAAGGREALAFALNLPDTMSTEEVERAALGAVSRGAFQHQSRGTITALPQPRAPSREAESEWFQKAKAHAESEWAKAMGLPMPQRQLTPEDVALAESFNAIAAKAAGLTHDPDSGQKRFKADVEDARLYAMGQASARKIWPGR